MDGSKNYRDIIMRYVSVEEDVFEKCNPCIKFNMTTQSLLVKGAEHKATSTVMLWKMAFVKT